ncbi:hypothetical protein Ahu01nite_082990 [Winogradskya humida]|uniref:Uncharacterized protein n=1 Tax=Winogradskya humida TaxID=113566 RepID=A0ABQ4A2X1_9ACTN|nr:hypothetical protein Ahu01nite_082990 [Actinoplanes humidus]
MRMLPGKLFVPERGSRAAVVPDTLQSPSTRIDGTRWMRVVLVSFEDGCSRRVRTCVRVLERLCFSPPRLMGAFDCSAADLLGDCFRRRRGMVQ